MEECFYNDNDKAYEIYIDETGKDGVAGYGVYCKPNSKNNYYSRVEGEQTLQNATYQGILHVLKGVPKNETINFIIDRKAVIDVFNKFPSTYRERQNTLHLDTLIQIENILKSRTAKINFKHCYPHTKDINNTDNNVKIQNKETKLAKLIELYGKEDAHRYVEGNEQADKLADKIYELPKESTPNITKYHNKYVLKSNRKKNTTKGNKGQIINTQICTTLKNIIRKE